jgi:hypothetical protein
MTFYCTISLYLGQRYLSVDLLDDNGKFHCLCAFLRKIKKKQKYTIHSLKETISLTKMRIVKITELSVVTK